MAGTDATCLAGSAAVASSPAIKQIQDLIHDAYKRFRNGGRGSTGAASLVGSASSSDGAALSFFLDELCHAVRSGRLVAPIREWLDELFQAEFESMYVGDFEEEDAHKGTKGGKGDGSGNEQQLTQIPTCQNDLALLNDSSTSKMAPPGALRFNIDGAESAVYLKLLPIMSSSDRSARNLLPVILCPMFRLMSTLCDLRFGGNGLAEIDAMLECPLLVPTKECSDFEFDELSQMQQWVVTSNNFFATCWMRQLINSFIYATSDAEIPSSGISSSAPAAVGSFTSSSQGFNAEEVRRKLVERLKALVQLEDDLEFTSSKCFTFAPPGMDPLPAPQELHDGRYTHDEENQVLNMNTDTKSMTKEEKKAFTAVKKAATKRAKDKAKSKTLRLKAKQKYEEQLKMRSMGALRPLDPEVCVCLGFPELSVVGQMGSQSDMSQGLSQQHFHLSSCCGPVNTLLLRLLEKSLSDEILEKKGAAFAARIGRDIADEDMSDNPYLEKGRGSVIDTGTSFLDIALASCEESSKKSFALLDSYLKGGVFSSLYEHLSAVAELRCGPNRTPDAETEKQLVETARCLFSCIRSIATSELLTKNAIGRVFLSSILKQVAEGDIDDYVSGNKKRRPTAATINKLLSYVLDNVREIVTGAYTADLDFAMDAVKSMEEIEHCSRRISDAIGTKRNGDVDDATPSFQTKMAELSDKLLRQNWPDDTKMNRGNVGKLLSLFIKHSSNRMECISRLVNDVLKEVPYLDKGKGVATHPTCSAQTFGCFYSTTLEYLFQELTSLFDSPLLKIRDPATSLDHLQEIIAMLDTLFGLTKDHESLAKTSILLHQLKFGSRFVESFVAKAIPFFQTHFQQHEDVILGIIRNVQKWSCQLYHIISHGKREKDANLAKEAPRAKKALEMFIHKVKALLKKNGCMTAMCEWCQLICDGLI